MDDSHWWWTWSFSSSLSASCNREFGFRLSTGWLHPLMLHRWHLHVMCFLSGLDRRGKFMKRPVWTGCSRRRSAGCGQSRFSLEPLAAVWTESGCRLCLPRPVASRVIWWNFFSCCSSRSCLIDLSGLLFGSSSTLLFSCIPQWTEIRWRTVLLFL